MLRALSVNGSCAREVGEGMQGCGRRDSSSGARTRRERSKSRRMKDSNMRVCINSSSIEIHVRGGRHHLATGSCLRGPPLRMIPSRRDQIFPRAASKQPIKTTMPGAQNHQPPRDRSRKYCTPTIPEAVPGFFRAHLCPYSAERAPVISLGPSSQHHIDGNAFLLSKFQQPPGRRAPYPARASHHQHLLAPRIHSAC